MREHTYTHISNPATSISGFPPFSATSPHISGAGECYFGVGIRYYRNRAYCNYKKFLAGNVSHKTTMTISGIFASRTSMDENISPMVRAPVHLFERDTRKIIIVLYPKKVHRSA